MPQPEEAILELDLYEIEEFLAGEASLAVATRNEDHVEIGTIERPAEALSSFGYEPKVEINVTLDTSASTARLSVSVRRTDDQASRLVVVLRTDDESVNSEINHHGYAHLEIPVASGSLPRLSLFEI